MKWLRKRAHWLQRFGLQEDIQELLSSERRLRRLEARAERYLRLLRALILQRFAERALQEDDPERMKEALSLLREGDLWL